MDETLRRTDRGPAADAGAEQEVLPFDRLPPVALPYPDDDADEPIGFTLTARARREVAPQDLPALAVVDDGALEQPADTRPSRARALRRAGVGLDDIARQLGVDELIVRAWAGDVVGGAPARRSTAGGAGAAASTDRGSVRALRAVDAAERPGERDDELAFDLARAAASEEARTRLRDEAGFAVGVGMLTAATAVDRHGVTLTTDRRELAAAVVGWLRDHAALRSPDVRVVLRLDRGDAGDVERHRWSDALGVPLDRVSYTRRRAQGRGEVEALVRVHDPSLAATVAGWSDAVLHPVVDPAGVAF